MARYGVSRSGPVPFVPNVHLEGVTRVTDGMYVMRRGGRTSGPWLLSAVLLVPGAALPGVASDPPPDGGEVSAEQAPADKTPAEKAPAVQRAADTTAPTISCAAPDDTWRRGNVAVGCRATDTGGLVHPEDAAFQLTTTVGAGQETASAATGARQVCDVAGNCATAGPIGPFRIDRKAPDIDVRVPAEGGKYGLLSDQNVGFECFDLGAGVLECKGDQAEGTRLKTGASTLGPRTFTIVAVDKVGNKRKLVRRYSVEPVVVPAGDGAPDKPPADSAGKKPPAAKPPIAINPPAAKPPKG